MHSEMTKLRIMLSRNRYTWIDDSEPYMKRTQFRHRGHLISVICGRTSYGGKRGLLEIYVPTAGIDATGYLTAREVMELVKERIVKDR